MQDVARSCMEGILSWSEKITSSRRAQLTATALISGATVAGIILGYQNTRKDRLVKALKSSIPSDDNHPSTIDTVDQAVQAFKQTHQVHSITSISKEDERSTALARRAQQGDYDNDLILEQLARNRVFLKDEGLERLRSAFVIVVGCGGVGSHTVAALARSGIAKIRLIDFDQVTLSSLNRHAVATLADVGTPKVDCIRKRLAQVTPWVKFDCRNELFGKAGADRQLSFWDEQKPSFVVDAIDNIDSKVELLKYCYDHKLPVISSMGAGCKSDPTRVFIGDISTSTDDPLSRATRSRLRAQGVANGIPVVFSSEKASPEKAQLQPLAPHEFVKGSVAELGVLPDFRVRILPVLGTMPAVFGLCVANHVMLEISGYPHDYLISKGREKMYASVLANLQGSEERLARWAGEEALGLRIPITQEDVGYLVEEIYRCRSIITGIPTRLTLVRWSLRKGEESFIDSTYPGQKTSKLVLSDLVCMTREEATKHENDVLKLGRSADEHYDASIVELVKKRKNEMKILEEYR